MPQRRRRRGRRDSPRKAEDPRPEGGDTPREEAAAESEDPARRGEATPAPEASGGPPGGGPPGGEARPRRGDSVVLEEAEVLASIESLYLDELKPFGRILRKRVAERAAPAGTVFDQDQAARLPPVDIHELKDVCKASPHLELAELEDEGGGDWSVRLVAQEDTFVDIYSDEDNFDDQAWAAAAAYFEALPDSQMELPGGRYLCARVLRARGLDFLSGLSLGRICHFIQICLRQRKLLGYLNGSVVPYGRSNSMAKDHCAKIGHPCARNNASATPSGGDTVERDSSEGTQLSLATWDTARKCLRDILAAAPVVDGGQGEVPRRMVPLSNVKRLMRSQFHLELSETALGHSKLSELLQDVRFQEVCSVQLRRSGYSVVEAQQPAGVGARADVQGADAGAPAAAARRPGRKTRGGAATVRARPPPLALEEGVAGVAAAAVAGALSASPLSASAASTASAYAPPVTSSSSPACVVPASVAAARRRGAEEDREFKGVALNFEECTKALEIPPSPPQPLPWDYVATPTSVTSPVCDQGGARPRWPTSRQGLRDYGALVGQDSEHPSLRPRHEDGSQTHSMESWKHSIRNTFLNFDDHPLLTPSQAGSRRARSLPKDVGSRRSPEEAVGPGVGPAAGGNVVPSLTMSSSEADAASGAPPAVGRAPSLNQTPRSTGFHGIATPTPEPSPAHQRWDSAAPLQLFGSERRELCLDSLV